MQAKHLIFGKYQGSVRKVQRHKDLLTKKIKPELKLEDVGTIKYSLWKEKLNLTI